MESFDQILCYKQDATQGRFKQQTASLNSDFSFSYTSYLTKTKNSVCSTIYP